MDETKDPLKLDKPEQFWFLSDAFTSNITSSPAPQIRRTRLPVVRVDIIERKRNFQSERAEKWASGAKQQGLFSQGTYTQPSGKAIASNPAEVYLRVEVYDTVTGETFFFRIERQQVGCLGNLRYLVRPVSISDVSVEGLFDPIRWRYQTL
ncbi:hypothetical protein CPB83DRAFT_858552 [Crepidotus variabilis]|uniref:Uncharacterized protein n=1 Tax=Crepidotus variabilis TaxID=179855 RepID=A0A9P6EBL4_9AGAR|nr:hypothetical protein CPB83DRAFT_858552 [Crepidotus variabilis]